MFVLMQAVFQLLVGTFGNNMYTAEFDPGTRELTVTGSVPARDPAFLTESEGFIYSVSENKVSGAYSFDSGLNQLSYSTEIGQGPCFIIKPEGCPYVLTAEYGGGTLSVLSVSDGRITGLARLMKFEGGGPVQERQAHARIHQVRPLYGRWLFASDFGSDKLRLLKLDASGMPRHIARGDVSLPAGSGPRHMEFNADRTRLYSIAEISREVFVFEVRHGAMPRLELMQSVSVPEVTEGDGGDIHMHPDGRWLYASQRNGDDGIAVFEVRDDGTLKRTGYCRTALHPRHFAVSPDGGSLLVACKNSNSIQVLSIDRETGLLSDTGHRVTFPSDSPVCILFR